MNYFLDTDICIFALKGKYSEIKRQLKKLSPDIIKIPSIVKAELLLGANKSKHPQKVFSIVQEFLLPFEIVPFCDKSAVYYAQIRYDLEKQGKIIGPNDLIIAATALANNAKLVTHNTKEYKRIKQLKVIDWLAT